MFQSAVVYFVQYLMPPVILTLGLIGNMLGSIVFTSKRIYKIGPHLMYRFLFATDTMYLACMIVNIHRMRQRIAENFRFNTNQTYRTNISLMASLFLLNVTYILSAMPVSIVGTYFSITDLPVIATLYLNYVPYAANFYIILATNSLFRKEFFFIFFKQ